jgi:hypothetical protein
VPSPQKLPQISGTQYARTLPIEGDYFVVFELLLEVISARQRAQTAELGPIGLAAAEWSELFKPSIGAKALQNRRGVIGGSELEKKIKKRQFIGLCCTADATAATDHMKTQDQPSLCRGSNNGSGNCRNRPSRPEWRLCVSFFLIAMPSAFLSPASTTNFFPRVMPV